MFSLPAAQEQHSNCAFLCDDKDFALRANEEYGEDGQKMPVFNNRSLRVAADACLSLLFLAFLSLVDMLLPWPVRQIPKMPLDISVSRCA